MKNLTLLLGTQASGKTTRVNQIMADYDFEKQVKYIDGGNFKKFATKKLSKHIRLFIAEGTTSVEQWLRIAKYAEQYPKVHFVVTSQQVGMAFPIEIERMYKIEILQHIF